MGIQGQFLLCLFFLILPSPTSLYNTWYSCNHKHLFIPLTFSMKARAKRGRRKIKWTELWDRYTAPLHAELYNWSPFFCFNSNGSAFLSISIEMSRCGSRLAEKCLVKGEGNRNVSYSYCILARETIFNYDRFFNQSYKLCVLYYKWEIIWKYTSDATLLSWITNLTRLKANT